MTRANDERPTRRIMSGREWRNLPGQDYTVEMFRTVVKVRPKGARRGGPAEVVVPIGALYQHGMAAKATEKRRLKALAKRGRTLKGR
jgi:hypothetical protein